MDTEPGTHSGMIARACELREAFWSLSRIAEMLEGEYSVRVSRFTVARWTDPKVAERKREEDRKRHAEQRWRLRGGRLGRDDQSPGFKAGRVLALRAVGLRPGSIAKVMAFDYAESWSRERVESILERGGAVRSYVRRTDRSLGPVDGRRAA